MTPFDLVFVAVVLTALVSLGITAVLALRGRRGQAVRRLKQLGIGLAAYLSAVTAVSLVTPRKVLELGVNQCSDDWCIAVVDISRATSTSGYEVTFRISSRARRAPQRERFVVAYPLDAAGSRYDVLPSGDEPPFDRRLDPGESVLTVRRFDVPSDAEGVGVVIGREGDFAFPRCCILGEGLFKRWPVVFGP